MAGGAGEDKAVAGGDAGVGNRGDVACANGVREAQSDGRAA